jgi:hypothetical protein
MRPRSQAILGYRTGTGNAAGMLEVSRLVRDGPGAAATAAPGVPRARRLVPRDHGARPQGNHGKAQIGS